MIDDTIEDKITKIAQNYAPHHDELRAGDSAWFAMGAICDLLGIKTGDGSRDATFAARDWIDDEAYSDSVDSEGNPCIIYDDYEEEVNHSDPDREDFHSDG